MRRSFVIAALLLAGCGFHPLYGGITGAARRLELGQIEITPIQSRLGVDLRNELIDRLTPDGEPAYPQYRLDLTLHDYQEGLAIQEDSSVTRWDYWLSADYKLTDLGTGKIVTKGVASSSSAYSVVNSQFATLSAENAAKRQTATDLGDELELRLALFFEQRAH